MPKWKMWTLIILVAGLVGLMAVPMLRADEKKLPPEVSIPEARVDKTKILALELRVINSDMQAIEAKYKELKAQQDDKQAKLFAEFSSALKAAGVSEDNLNKYQVNLETLKLTLRPEEPAKEPVKK